MTKAADKIKAIANQDQDEQPEPDVALTPEEVAATEPQEQAPKTLGVQAQREALRAAGYKRCPTHLTYLDRLPEASQAPMDGYEDDVSVRPLSDFSATTAACKACATLREADKRTERHSDAPSGAAKRLAGLIRKHDVLQAKIDALKGTLSNDDQDAAEQLYHDTQQS